MSVEELHAAFGSGAEDGDTLIASVRDFRHGLYGASYRPLDAGRSKQMLDWVYDNIVYPSVNGRGFRINRSSELDLPEYATRTHVEKSLRAGLMIADLSMNDPVVPYCVALRMQKAEHTDRHHGIIMLRDLQTNSMFDIPGPFDEPVRYALVAEDAAPIEKRGSLTEEGRREVMEKNTRDARSDLTRRVMHFKTRQEIDAEERRRRAAANAASGGHGPGGGAGLGARGPDNDSPNDGGTGDSADRSGKAEDKRFSEEMIRIMREVLREDTKSDSIERLKRRLMRGM